MASYTTTEALHMILNSTDDFDLEDDPDSGDESDIQEDPLFPLPRQDSSENESVNGEGGSEMNLQREREMSQRSKRGSLEILQQKMDLTVMKVKVIQFLCRGNVENKDTNSLSI